jgi:hypothetical protein
MELDQRVNYVSFWYVEVNGKTRTIGLKGTHQERSNFVVESDAYESNGPDFQVKREGYMCKRTKTERNKGEKKNEKCGVRIYLRSLPAIQFCRQPTRDDTTRPTMGKWFSPHC